MSREQELESLKKEAQTLRDDVQKLEDRIGKLSNEKEWGGAMKIAISAAGPALDAEVDPRFGRCRYFIIADPETMNFEAVDNSGAASGGGAGIAAAQEIANREIAALLTGNCGPNAHQVLSSAGIKVITGVSGIIKDVMEDYRAGKLVPSAQPNVPDHFGTSAGRGTGRGLGRGGGKGMGRGRR
jgi:predicted Fe-Mo cluster-binding NifX family protein